LSSGLLVFRGHAFASCEKQKADAHIPNSVSTAHNLSFTYTELLGELSAAKMLREGQAQSLRA